MITHLPVLGGTINYSCIIRIVDATAGTPETAVEHDSAGIDLFYRRDGATRTAITEVALATVDAAHSDGGIEHISDGYYRLDLPDAAVASGVTYVVAGGTVTGMIVIGAMIPIVAYNPADSVRLGLTSLPNAAAAAAGGLFTRGTGAGQINQDADGRIDVNLTAISEDATAAVNLEALMDGVITGVAQTGTLTTRSFTSDLSGLSADQIIGAIGKFATGNAAGRPFAVVDYITTNGEVFVAPDLPAAPANNDPFYFLP